MSDNNNNNSHSSDSDNDDDAGEQIRVALTLSSEVTDRSLEVPTESIAVPATIGRKGLAAVINHLLGRKVGNEDEEDDASDNSDNEELLLPALAFEFVFYDNNRMLRTGVEREARRYGLSLEKPLSIIYFPAQEVPELQGESEQLPDWISCLEYVTTDQNYLCAAAYDGSLRVYQPTMEHHDEESVQLTPLATASKAHSGAIKCLSVMKTNNEEDGNLLLASGSMDHTLAVHSYDTKTQKLHKLWKCQQGHAAAIGCVDFFPPNQTLASGDWDGTLCVWDFKKADNDSANADMEEEHASKKVKTGDKSSKKTHHHSHSSIRPKVIIPQAHNSQISGCSWGNLQKTKGAKDHNTLITASWDHSVKTWDIERQECVLSLNGSRVVACMDTSYHSEGIVATGHPDCAIRLWDVRTSSSTTTSVVSDKTFRPSHKAWVSAVQWSPNNPYHLASTSHDGTVRLWDIRSSLPLHTVRVFSKAEKGMCMAYGQHAEAQSSGKDGSAAASLFLGGTDCIVKQFTTSG